MSDDEEMIYSWEEMTMFLKRIERNIYAEVMREENGTFITTQNVLNIGDRDLQNLKPIVHKLNITPSSPINETETTTQNNNPITNELPRYKIQVTKEIYDELSKISIKPPNVVFKENHIHYDQIVPGLVAQDLYNKYKGESFGVKVFAEILG